MRIRLGGTSLLFENDDNALINLKNHFSKLKSLKGQPLSQTSINNYVAKINRMAVLCTNKAFLNDDFLMSPPAVLIKLGHSGLKSKKDYISAISKYLSGCTNIDPSIIKTYQDAMAEMKKEQSNIRGDNLASAKNVNNSLGLKEIQKRLKNYKITNNDELLNAVIVAFYFGNTDNLILRNDLVNMKIISPSKAKKPLNANFNYLVVSNKGVPEKIIMVSYKTAKTYGERSFNISNELKKILVLYLKRFNKKYNDFLFTRRDGVTPFTISTFSRIIENAMYDILGKKIGIDLARQIIATNFYLTNPLASKNQKEEFAGKFLHSLNTNLEYMRRNLKK
jgi:hypothetical protein